MKTKIEKDLGMCDQKEREFMEELYRKYERLMYATVRRYISDSMEQEEIVQESLKKLIEKRRVLCNLDCAAQAGYIVVAIRNIDVNVVQYSEKTIHKFDSEESRKSNVEIQGYSATLYEKDLDSVYSQTLVWLDEENHYIIQITSTGEAKNALTSDQLVMLAEGLRW